MTQDDKINRLKLAARFASVPMKVEVELDRLTMTVREVLALEVGTILRTSKRPGDPLEFRVSGENLAPAEMVKTGDKAAVRLRAARRKSQSSC